MCMKYSGQFKILWQAWKHDAIVYPSRETHYRSLKSYVAWTQRYQYGHDTRTHWKFLKIHMTRVPDMCPT